MDIIILLHEIQFSESNRGIIQTRNIIAYRSCNINSQAETILKLSTDRQDIKVTALLAVTHA